MPDASDRAARPRRALAALALTFAAAVATAPLLFGGDAAGSTAGSLEGGIASARAHEGEVSAGIGADTRQIQGFQGNIDDLQARLSALETSLATERRVLAGLRSQLSAARAQLAVLKVQLAHDKQVLVAQVIASYEAPPPDVATVILEAHGFADLIERFDDLRAISRENAAATTNVAETQKAVTAEAERLTLLESSHARETQAMTVQRDEVAQLHLALVDRQLQFIRARNRKSAEIGELREHRKALEGELSKIQASELSAGSGTFSGSVGSYSATPQGEYGFFPAPGTNYTVGEEPVLVAHLNTLGKALHLHLIGISGYRTPQHSVEVGGFADDPHTRGEASDTPGIEGVPEATLNQFGLTRPFPGAAEADHIQLLGSRY